MRRGRAEENRGKTNEKGGRGRDRKGGGERGERGGAGREEEEKT